jgi:Domain of Unknown Function (DUF1206)
MTERAEIRRLEKFCEASDDWILECSHTDAGDPFAGALGVIQQQPYGSALLGITAAGLLAFGLYGIAEAVYRWISPPRLPMTK